MTVSDCIIQCGDDAIAFTQESPLTETSMADVVVSNCYLWSRRANALKFLIGADITQTISRVRVSNVVAKTGISTQLTGAGIILRDHNGANRIFDIEIDGFWLDAAFSAGEPIYIRGVRDVRLQKVVCMTPDGPARIDNCQDIELRDCVIDSPRNTDTACLEVATSTTTGGGSCTNVRVLGGRYLNSKTRGVVMGSISPSFSVEPFEISNTQITGAAMAGLYIPRANNGLVSNNTITGNTGVGINEEATSSANLFVANRLQGNGAGAISSPGSNSQVVRNVTTPGQFIADSGGFRQTIDGWTQENVAASQTNAELTRAVGRFRAARPGSVTGIVVTSTVARTGGTLTVRAYKNDNALAGVAGSSMGLTAILDATNTSRKATTQAENASPFAAGDELYIVVTTDASWAPATADIRCALEIED